MAIEITGSRRWLINFYREQLNKFKNIGMNRITEFNVRVTPKLIAATEKRLDQLTLVYDSALTPQAHALRRLQLRRLKQEGQLNGKIKRSEAAKTKGSENIRTNGHERSET